MTEDGAFEHGASTLQRLHEAADTFRLDSVRARLAAARALRAQPQRDDKVVTAWNGLAIAALAEHGVLTGVEASLTAARSAADLLARTHWAGGRLVRASRHGVAGRHAGVLEDYADLAEGLLALHQATTEGRWLDLAGNLLDVVVEQFVAVSGPAGPVHEVLAATARASTSPGAVVVGESDAPDVPLLAGRPAIGGPPAAYVCRGFVCSATVTEPSALGAAMRTTGR